MGGGGHVLFEWHSHKYFDQILRWPIHIDFELTISISIFAKNEETRHIRSMLKRISKFDVTEKLQNFKRVKRIGFSEIVNIKKKITTITTVGPSEHHYR